MVRLVAPTIADPARRQTLKAIFALALLGMTGCSRPMSPLRVASHVWVGYEFMFLARNLGWLDEQNIQLLETSAPSDSMHLLASEMADAAALTLDEVIRMYAQGMPLEVALIFDFSAGADAVIGKPGLRNLGDIKGRRIGVENSALGGFMLSRTLDHAGLSPADIQLVELPVDQHLSAWKSGTVDALVTFEPVLSKLLLLGGKRLFDSTRIPNEICDVLAVRSSLPREKKEALRELVKLHFRAIDHFAHNPEDTAYRMAGRLKLAPDEVSASFNGIHISTLEENTQYLQQPTTLLASAQKLQERLIEQNLVAAPVDLKKLFSASYLPGAPALS